MKQVFFILAMLATAAVANAQNITTIVGGGDVLGNNAHMNVGFIKPEMLSIDASGNVYMYCSASDKIKKITVATSMMTTIGGCDTCTGFWGDAAAPATSSIIYGVGGIAADPSGNVYYTDIDRIRKISTSGVLTTITGTLAPGFSGDGGPAAAAQIDDAGALATDAAGNLYVCDRNNSRIRKISTSGIITTIAGNGGSGYTGDGGPATAAAIGSPISITVVPTGEIYFFDYDNYRLRRISTSGIITTYAGNGSSSSTGLAAYDGGPAIASPVEAFVLTHDNSGNLYLSGNIPAVRKISTSGIITRHAGIYISTGYTGDGGPATAAYMTPRGLVVDATNNLYISDAYYAIRKVNAAGIIDHWAGNKYTFYTGNGGPAQNAPVQAHEVNVDTAGNMYFFDYFTMNVRKVDAATGIITKYCGTGTPGYWGDDGPATDANIGVKCYTALDKNGNLLVCDRDNHAIRKIDRVTGIITRIAGTGTTGFTGDGGPATNAKLATPVAIAVDTAGNIFVADRFNYRIRKISTSGIITTAAGNGTPALTGNGGPATAAGFGQIDHMAIARNGDIYVSDVYCVRKITKTTGIIDRYAGSSFFGYAGDGGPATSAELYLPSCVTLDDTGSLFISCYDTHKIRKVDTFGVITTYSGYTTSGFSGDGGPINLAEYYTLLYSSHDRLQNKYISDFGNYRIRFICASDTVASSISIASSASPVCPGASVTFTSSVINTGAAPGYQWKKNAISIAGATSASYTTSALAAGDIITCVLTPNNLAPCAMNNTVTSAGITVSAAAPTPSSISISQSPAVISFPGETITFTASYINGGTAPTFQWYKNSVLIPGATANPYITTDVVNGDAISVTVSTTDACADPASGTGAMTTGIVTTQRSKVNIDLYPNPNKGSFTIKGYFADANEAVIEVTNATGSIVAKEKVTLKNNYMNKTIDLGANIAKGVYFVRVLTNGAVNTYMVAVQ